MLKVAMPTQLPNLGGMKTNVCTTDFRFTGEDGDLLIPNVSAYYRSPYNGRIKCKKVSKHPRIITDENKEELPAIPCEPEMIESIKSDKHSTGSSEGSDNHSYISCSNSSGLRGILTKRCENKKDKKSGKRVKFHEQLENVREVKPLPCKSYKPHPLSRNLKENTFSKLSYRATSSDSDLFRKRKHQYDVDRQTLSCSDFDKISVENISPEFSSNGSTFCEGLKQVRTLFKSPLRHSYQQQNRSDSYSPQKPDFRCHQTEVKLHAAIGRRSDPVLSICSPKVIRDSSGQKFVVCRFAMPNRDDISFSSMPSQRDNILKLQQGLKPVLPEQLASIGMCSTSFCNRDKASRIMRWLDSVDDIHTKEGRYAELLDTVFYSDRNG